jgi:hypothetical protein
LKYLLNRARHALIDVGLDAFVLTAYHEGVGDLRQSDAVPSLEVSHRTRHKSACVGEPDMAGGIVHTILGNDSLK